MAICAEKRSMAFNSKLLLLTVCLCLFPSALAWAERKTPFNLKPFYAYGSYAITLADSESDKVSGAIYQKKMTTPQVGSLGVGMSPLNSIWVGLRYDYWFAKRQMTLGGVDQEDSLKLQLLGPELGYIRGNPRVAYLFAFGAMVPIQQSIASNPNGNFTSDKKDLSYQARAAIQLRLDSHFAVHFECGYRLIKIRELNNSGTSFVPGNKDVDLSGPFVGAGLGIFF